MLNICTHCDINYLPKFLALYKSLCDTGGEFELLFLCDDDETFDRMKEYDLDYVVFYRLSDYESHSEDLQRAKNNPKCHYGSQRDNYLWSITPWWVNECLNSLKKGDQLIYCDTDIYFYKSPQVILGTIGERSVGIHTHRFTKPFQDLKTGWYNVGVVVIRNNEHGRKVARQWKDWAIDISNPHYVTHGTCGDQKYLELFDTIIPKEEICVFDEEWNYVHLAPWCAQNPEQKEVVFYHFSHFQYLGRREWKDHVRTARPEWHPSRDPYIRTFYENYHKAISSVWNG